MSTSGGVHKSPRVTSTFLTLVPVRIHQTTSTLTTSFLFIPRNSWKEKADSIEPAIYETGVPNNFPLDSFPDFVIIPPSTARKYSRFDQTCPQPCPSFLPSIFHHRSSSFSFSFRPLPSPQRKERVPLSHRGPSWLNFETFDRRSNKGDADVATILGKWYLPRLQSTLETTARRGNDRSI